MQRVRELPDLAESVEVAVDESDYTQDLHHFAVLPNGFTLPFPNSFFGMQVWIHVILWMRVIL